CRHDRDREGICHRDHWRGRQSRGGDYFRGRGWSDRKLHDPVCQSPPNPHPGLYAAAAGSRTTSHKGDLSKTRRECPTKVGPACPMLPDRVRISRRGWFLVVAVIIVLLPFVIQDSYWRTNLIVCAINIMLAIGLDFILGYAGQLNLGHSAFYGIGAYASTLLIMKLGVPFWMAFVLGMVLSGAAGMALSIFAVSLRGHYLAIASLGFAVIVHQVLLNWISLTQGPLGIYAIKPPPEIALPGLPVISFGNAANMFYLVASFAFLFYLLLDQLVRSPIGETLKAIREDEISASAFGINCTAWKVFAFGIGSAVAGAAGA